MYSTNCITLTLQTRVYFEQKDLRLYWNICGEEGNVKTGETRNL